MNENFFTFAGDRSTEYTFLFWCLLWYNDKSEPRNPLFYMAKDLLSCMGEDGLSEEQRIDIFRLEEKGIDLVVNLRGLNRVLVIDHKIGTTWYDDKHFNYREVLLQNSKFMGIDESVEIRTILFETYYCKNEYCVTDTDCKIYKLSLLDILQRHEGINKSLDLYIDSLRERIAVDKGEEQYNKIVSFGDTTDWLISRSSYAQYHFMRDMCHPIYLQDKTKDTFITTSGSSGLYCWNEFSIIEGTNSDDEINYSLFWHLGADHDGPYISLHFQERCVFQDSCPLGKFDAVIKQKAEEFFFHHPEFGLDWAEIKSGFVETNLIGASKKEYTREILSIPLNNQLEHWEVEKENLQHFMLSISDYFLREVPEEMRKGRILE